MKKALLFILIIFIVLIPTVNVGAEATTTSYVNNTYYIKDLKLTVKMPSTAIVATRDKKLSDSLVQQYYGISSAELDTWMEENDIYLDTLGYDDNNTIQYEINIIGKPFSISAGNFSDYTEEELMKLLAEEIVECEKNGITLYNYGIQTINDNYYFVIEGNNGSQELVMYELIIGNYDIVFSGFCYNCPYSMVKDAVRSLVNSAVYDPSIQFTNKPTTASAQAENTPMPQLSADDSSSETTIKPQESETLVNALVSTGENLLINVLTKALAGGIMAAVIVGIVAMVKSINRKLEQSDTKDSTLAKQKNVSDPQLINAESMTEDSNKLEGDNVKEKELSIDNIFTKQNEEETVPVIQEISQEEKKEAGEIEKEITPPRRFCRMCGAPLLEDSIFCSQCGERVK